MKYLDPSARPEHFVHSRGVILQRVANHKRSLRLGRERIYLVRKPQEFIGLQADFFHPGQVHNLGEGNVKQRVGVKSLCVELNVLQG